MASLPGEFAELEPFSAKWSLATEPERWAERTSSSMDEMQAFYDAAFARIDDALSHLDQHELKALPEDANNLLYLYCSLVNVSFPVEVWKQPRVLDSGAAYIECIKEPVV